jgi:hypothetical protein
MQGDVLDLEFEIPQPGTSICQFLEGVTKRTNEASGKTTLQLPLQIDTVLEGPDDNEGRKLSHFVPIETPFGEKQLSGILTLTGLIDSFAARFGGDIDATSDKLINALKLKLPGKFVKVTHVVRKDGQGKDRCNVIKVEAATNKASSAKKQSSAKQEGDAGGDDW